MKDYHYFAIAVVALLVFILGACAAASYNRKGITIITDVEETHKSITIKSCLAFMENEHLTCSLGIEVLKSQLEQCEKKLR